MKNGLLIFQVQEKSMKIKISIALQQMECGWSTPKISKEVE